MICWVCFIFFDDPMFLEGQTRCVWCGWIRRYCGQNISQHLWSCYDVIIRKWIFLKPNLNSKRGFRKDPVQGSWLGHTTNDPLLHPSTNLHGERDRTTTTATTTTKQANKALFIMESTGQRQSHLCCGCCCDCRYVRIVVGATCKGRKLQSSTRSPLDQVFASEWRGVNE